MCSSHIRRRIALTSFRLSCLPHHVVVVWEPTRTVRRKSKAHFLPCSRCDTFITRCKDCVLILLFGLHPPRTERMISRFLPSNRRSIIFPVPVYVSNTYILCENVRDLTSRQKILDHSFRRGGWWVWLYTTGKYCRVVRNYYTSVSYFQWEIRKGLVWYGTCTTRHYTTLHYKTRH